MTSKSPEINNFALNLPITTSIRQIAFQFARQQPTTQKAEQVKLNTIAVAVVNNYLTMLGITTNLTQSDSWNPVMQLCENVADLEITGVGKLECRPIKVNSDRCQIPLEVWDFRLGYVVVSIDDSYKKATILGFIRQIKQEILALGDLQPPESLIEQIHQLQASVTDNSVVNLGQWLNNIFTTGWQTIDNLLNPELLTPALNFRNAELSSSERSQDRSLTRVKSINLGVSSNELDVLLSVTLTPEDNNEIDIILRVYPQANEVYLPAALELKVLEASNTVFMEAQARERDNYIQLQFSGQPQEIFQVVVTLNGVTFSEQFQL